MSSKSTLGDLTLGSRTHFNEDNKQASLGAAYEDRLKAKLVVSGMDGTLPTGKDLREIYGSGELGYSFEELGLTPFGRYEWHSELNDQWFAGVNYQPGDALTFRAEVSSSNGKLPNGGVAVMQWNPQFSD